MKVACLFDSTFLCESAFPDMNFIKNKHRTRVTDGHLKDCISVMVSGYTPDLLGTYGHYAMSMLLFYCCCSAETCSYVDAQRQTRVDRKHSFIECTGRAQPSAGDDGTGCY